MRPALLALLTACGMHHPPARDAGVVIVADAGGVETPCCAPFTAPPTSWVTAAPGGRYLAVDGAPFLVIGNQPGSGFLDLPDAEIEAHFARMQANGETVARLDFDVAYEPDRLRGLPARYFGIESKLGVYDAARVARIDKAFELAARHDVRILVVPFVTSPPMWGTWSVNPYSTAMGGPAADPYAFMTSPVTRAAFGARLEWIAERWGGSGTFFAWDLMNESGVLVGDHPDGAVQLKAWVTEIADRVARKERALYGREHLRHVSWWTTIPPPGYEFLFDSPSLNTASTHPYDDYGTNMESGAETRMDFLAPAAITHTKVLGIVSRIRRPYFENEHHQNDHTMLSFYREADHHLAWAELASGAAGTGLTWLVTSNERHAARVHMGFAERHEALGPGRRALSEFIHQRVPASFFLSDTTDEGADVLVGADPAVQAMSIRRGTTAIAWLAGTDDRCLQVRGVEDVRALRASRAEYNAFEGGLALMIWSKLLADDGAPVDTSKAAELIASIRARDYEGALAAEDGLFTYLEGLEQSAQVLTRYATCPALQPSLTVAMPAGAYRVDWIDDRTGAVLRSDAHVAAGSTVTPPSFSNHLAAVVTQESP